MKNANAKKDQLDRAWLLGLPLHMKSPKAVLLDTTHDRPSVLLVFDHAGDGRNKIVVQSDYSVKMRKPDGSRETVKANVINTGKIVPVANLTEYKVLCGTL